MFEFFRCDARNKLILTKSDPLNTKMTKQCSNTQF